MGKRVGKVGLLSGLSDPYPFSRVFKQLSGHRIVSIRSFVGPWSSRHEGMDSEPMARFVAFVAMGLLSMGVATACTDSNQAGRTEGSAGGNAGTWGSSGAAGKSTVGSSEAGAPNGTGGAIAGGGGGGGGKGGDTTMSPDPAPVGPVVPAFWNASTMSEESVLFIQEAGQETATARLLFVPEQIGAIHGANGIRTFALGKDLQWTPGSRELTLTKDSTTPFKTTAEMHPPNGSPQSIGSADGKTALFFSEGHVFHDLQVQVTYAHSDRWEGHKSAFSGASLPRTLDRLKQKQPLKLVVLGDSISEGYNASGFVDAPPYSPPYANLVAAALEEAYQSVVTVKNLAVAGETSTWGLGKASELAAENPDLALIAFGMNDGAVQPFATNIEQIVSAVRQAAPDTEFILVATMASNPEWIVDAAFFPAGRDALAALTGPGVALADVTSVWLDVVARKKFSDMTGNGVNHPNDFGHRLYAQVIAHLLLPP